MFGKMIKKARLTEVFRSGEIYLKYGNKGTPIYPKIHSIRNKGEVTEYVFTLPLGLNPEKIDKGLWVFQQEYGENIYLKRENKKCVLTVYRSDLPMKLPFRTIETEHSLPIIVGQSYRGFISYDMVKYPHLLVAGETGSGKSTQLRSILCHLISNVSPSNMNLYLADMKRSEFGIFRNVKHVKDVVMSVPELERVLKEIQKEMKSRGTLLDEAEVPHIDDLDHKLPYIVLCIDEVALLKKEKLCMEIVEEISAIGRSLGVFLILSMQRPDAGVLDGKLKNNLTVRMAFRHSDEINSRITIGSGDAANIKLEHRGRMYFKQEKLELVQGPYLEFDDAKKILSPYKEKKPPKPEQPIFGVLE